MIHNLTQKTIDKSCYYKPCGERCTSSHRSAKQEKVCQPDRTCGVNLNPECPGIIFGNTYYEM